MKLLPFLQLVGKASGQDLVQYVTEDNLPEKLEKLQADGVISIHTSGYGEKAYRCPPYEKKRKDNIGQLVLDYITNNPGCNGSQIKKGIGKSYIAVDERLMYFVGRGLVEKKPSGVAFLYFVRKPSEVSTVPAKKVRRKLVEPVSRNPGL